ncbi:MAG: AraC family transcriptional regulator [Bacteroidales bacterium]|jgi:AraC-like DNA-binding protein|nr:AraC family transcriptional regulator [Bacteroidales bacterium]MDD2425502.1 AraC family transcriptional regulator [Bacteroidales bacterium]MDD3989774.1 AraC family transcriptional regulator [Bacteroidales bacterium]
MQTRSEHIEFPQKHQIRIKSGFKSFSLKKGSSFEMVKDPGNIIIFLHLGRVRVLVGKYKEYIFSDRTMLMINNGLYQLEVLQNSEITILGLDHHWIDFYKSMLGKNGKNRDKFLFSLFSLPIEPRVEVFLESLSFLLSRRDSARALQTDKQRELELLLRRCYSKKALLGFFARICTDCQDFYTFIQDNYHKQRGVEELITISGLSQSTFNRKFREMFGESPYQWIMGKRAESILKKLSDKSIPMSKIIKEYNFTDASHFNRFCKLMYQKTPSEIRKNNIKEDST